MILLLWTKNIVSKLVIQISSLTYFFIIDLCLVVVELKIDVFCPEHLGQLNFYFEALDRDVKKTNENSSVSLIIYTTKDDTVVEYLLSRTLSSTIVAEYTLHLPNKTTL